MRTLKIASLALLIMAIASFTGVSLSHASSNDDSHLSANDSVYSPPGYMNKDIQQARSLTDKYLANKDKAANKTEATQREVSQKVQVQAVDKPKPQLKQKQSSKNTSTKAQPAATANTNNINIGTGTSQEKDAAGRVISEVIDGQRYVYAGFSNVGKATIADAIAAAGAGDKVIVKAGAYSGIIVLKDGVSLYGGYGEDGKRDLTNTPTLINGGFRVDNAYAPSAYGGYEQIYGITTNTEVNGFTINAMADENGNIRGFYIPAAKNITISNNIFNGSASAYGIESGSSQITVKNNIFNTGYGMVITGLVGGFMVASKVDPRDSMTLLEHNDFNGTYGIQTKGAITGISSSNDYFNTAYRVVDGSNEDIFALGYNVTEPNVGIVGPGGAIALKAPNIGFGFDPVDPALVSIVDPTLSSSVQRFTAVSTSEITIKNTPYYSNFTSYGLAVLFAPMYASTAKDTDIAAASAIFKNLLRSKDGFLSKDTGQIDPALVVRLSEDALKQSALTLPQSQVGKEEIDVAMRLSNILKNPTDAQKVTIDSIKALLNDVNKIEDASGNQSPDLKKATDDLLNAVANILLAQAMPDLIKSGDVSNIKAMFSELDTQRNKIMLDYSIATKPYYENMIKDMAKNMAMLQGKNLLNPNMSKEELSKLPPSELDKILEKIRNMKDKSFEEEYLLQQEAKYRKDYLDPNNKKLENDMKGMLESFAGRINDVLKSADKK